MWFFPSHLSLRASLVTCLQSLTVKIQGVSPHRQQQSIPEKRKSNIAGREPGYPVTSRVWWDVKSTTLAHGCPLGQGSQLKRIPEFCPNHPGIPRRLATLSKLLQGCYKGNPLGPQLAILRGGFAFQLFACCWHLCTGMNFDNCVNNAKIHGDEAFVVLRWHGCVAHYSYCG